MTRSRKTERIEEHTGETDHTVAWLVLILLVLAALVIAVLLGDSIALPQG